MKFEKNGFITELELRRIRRQPLGFNIQDFKDISKNGKIRHLQLNGQYLEKNGRPTSVGVVLNISKKVRADEKLRLRNLELKRSNIELESFNRVASHDLQEPLRKIQMFLSRIEDKEGDELYGGRTLPIVFGVNIAKITAFLMGLSNLSKVIRDENQLWNMCQIFLIGLGLSPQDNYRKLK